MDNAWKQNALKIIEKIFQEQFFDDSLCITEYTTPAEIEEWDSLAHVNLLAAIENAFDIRFTAEDMANIDSIYVLISTMAERGANKLSQH